MLPLPVAMTALRPLLQIVAWVTLVALALTAPLAAPSSAEVPLQFATIKVRAPNDPDVRGVRFSVLHGENRSIRGLDLGLLSSSRTGSLTGFGAVLGLGRLEGDLQGCALSVVNSHRGRDRGANLAVVNQIQNMDAGVNVGFVNTTSAFSMVDVGAVNVSGRGTVQVGVVNVTGQLRAVQIGILNVAENGFLPVFPFFNFPVRSRTAPPATAP